MAATAAAATSMPSTVSTRDIEDPEPLVCATRWLAASVWSLGVGVAGVVPLVETVDAPELAAGDGAASAAVVGRRSVELADVGTADDEVMAPVGVG